MLPPPMVVFLCKLISRCDYLTAAYPDAPQSLEVLSATWESIELQWAAGFDGGYEQDFVVVITASTLQTPMYRQTGSMTTYNVTGCALLVNSLNSRF